MVEPWLPAALEPLRALSQNLYWTWCPGAAALFARLSPQLWEETGHNPVLLLQRMPRPALEARASDGAFIEGLTAAETAFRGYLARPPAPTPPGTAPAEVAAYFSFEFALTESLPTYSGGLGVLAGDHVKSASDLGLPLVAMGLLYRQGYFQQSLGADGWQIEQYHDLDPASHAMRPVLNDSGEELKITVPFPGREVVVGVWRLEVGQVPLYLLDTAVAENSEADRAIASRLYGGDIETRIQQEMVLGIGGIRALRAMGLLAGVCHMNEGHSSLLAVERIRLLMEEERCSFEEARIPVAAATAFTTHTAVAAGIDLFAPDLIVRYLGGYYQAMGLDDHAFLGLGRMDAANDQEPFSMAMLGLRLSAFRTSECLAPVRGKE